MCLFLSLTGWSCYSKSLTTLLKRVLFVEREDLFWYQKHNSHSRRICCWGEEDDGGNMNQSKLGGAARKKCISKVKDEYWTDFDKLSEGDLTVFGNKLPQKDDVADIAAVSSWGDQLDQFSDFVCIWARGLEILEFPFNTLLSRCVACWWSVRFPMVWGFLLLYLVTTFTKTSMLGAHTTVMLYIWP